MVRLGREETEGSNPSRTKKEEGIYRGGRRNETKRVRKEVGTRCRREKSK